MLKNKVRESLVIVVVVCSTFFLSMCATFYHAKIMKGQVLDVKNNMAYICIGTRDGAKVGQMFKVYQYNISYGGGGTATGSLVTKYIGEIKIAEIVNTHYAKATILSGNIQKGDMAELENKN